MDAEARARLAAEEIDELKAGIERVYELKLPLAPRRALLDLLARSLGRAIAARDAALREIAISTGAYAFDPPSGTYTFPAALADQNISIEDDGVYVVREDGELVPIEEAVEELPEPLRNALRNYAERNGCQCDYCEAIRRRAKKRAAAEAAKLDPDRPLVGADQRLLAEMKIRW